MIRRTLGTILVLAVVPLALEAQLPAQAQAPDHVQERIDAAMSRVEAQGIPVSLVQSSVAESQAKGISAERIAEAAERRADALLRAQNAFARAGVEPRDVDYAAGADAIGRGVSEAAVGDVARSAPVESRAVAIAVLDQLMGMGIPVEDALGRVSAAGAAGPEVLADLPAQAAAAMGRRGPPEGMGQGQGGPPASAGPPSTVPASGREAGARGGDRRGPAGNRPGGPPNL